MDAIFADRIRTLSSSFPRGKEISFDRGKFLRSVSTGIGIRIHRIMASDIEIFIGIQLYDFLNFIRSQRPMIETLPHCIGSWREIFENLSKLIVSSRF